MDHITISDGVTTKKFKIVKPMRATIDMAIKKQRTVGGINIVRGKPYDAVAYNIRVPYSTGDASYGTLNDLRQILKHNGSLAVTDIYGVQHTAYIVSDPTNTPISTQVIGDCAYYIMRVEFLFDD